MANTGFGQVTYPNPEDRQYPLSIYYPIGINPADATAGAVFYLPPGATITGGTLTVSTVGTGTITVVDNQASPVSIFGSVSATAAASTAAVATPSYPNGATLTLSATNIVGTLRVEYVVAGRANEVGVI